MLNGNKYDYHDVQLNGSIQYACHALAIDEQRCPFMPNMWTKPLGWAGNLEQAWFPGVHSNIGGGYTPDGLANEALHQMVGKARALGLEFDDSYLAFFEPHYESKLHDSMSAKYRIFGVNHPPIGEHLADGEGIHRFAVDRWENFEDYRPPTLKRYFATAGMPVRT